MKSKTAIFIISATLFITVTVGTTFAFLMSASRPLNNTFTLGNVKIALKETTGNEYKIIPGATINKNPTVTQMAGSEACWLYVEIKKSSDFDDYMTYELADGWQLLSGVNNVYYREAPETDTDIDYQIIKDNAVLVYDTVTEEKLKEIVNKPNLEITAFAIQRETIDDPINAWEILKQERE